MKAKPIFKKVSPSSPWVLCDRKECIWNHTYKNMDCCDKILIVIKGDGCDGYEKGDSDAAD